ncbi:MAG TPA: YbaB/EbfC family nucleoid-associated protein [Haliangiales bacterium]|nr:YbaB/EbfC family nucleoid-associated protein [Haliangiales bacterium]
MGNEDMLSGLLEAAQRMQKDLAKAQEDLAQKRVEASAGGGMVVAVVTGKLELVELKIEATVVDPKDIGMLQDLVVAAVNQALAKAKSMAQAELSKLTGGMQLPGMPNLF